MRTFTPSPTAHSLTRCDVRKGDRLIVSPGRARNQLLPRVQALYVVNGVAISPLRAMVRKEQARVSGRVLRPANMVELEEVLEIVRPFPSVPSECD